MLLTDAVSGQDLYSTNFNPGVNKMVDSATQFMRAGSNEEALAVYERIVLIDSTHLLLYANKHALEGMLRKYDKDVITSARMCELAPHEPWFLLITGTLYEKTGDSVNGKKYLDKTVIQCDIILDTLNQNNSFLVETYKCWKALAVFFSGNERSGNMLLSELYKENEDPARAVYKFLNKSREQMFKVWLDE